MCSAFPNSAHGCLIDYSGHPKAALYYSQRAMAPLDVSLRYDHIWAPAGEAINATVYIDDETVRATDAPPVVVVAEAWSARNGQLLHTQEWTVSLASQVVTEIGTLSFAPSAADVGDTVILILEAREPNCSYPRCVGDGCYQSLRNTSNTTCVQSSHSYTFGIAAAEATADELSAPLAALRSANDTNASSCITAVVQNTSSPGTSAGVLVHNSGPALAFMVRVVPHDSEGLISGEAVPWVALTDNYFSLRPHEFKVVGVRQLGSASEVAGFRVTSWNSQRVLAAAVK